MKHRNRIIVFRGKSSMCDVWLHGYLFRIGGKPYIADDNDFDIDSHHIEQVFDMPLEVKEDTICQYTELVDYNGREIYEGDILRVTCEDEDGKDKEYICYVGWRHEIGAWCMFLGDTPLSAEPLGIWLYTDKIEVIGNIYDNKELLKNY